MGIESGARRRRAEGGYSRSEETRARLVEAALTVFGDEGYERASTRRIAEVAGVAPPALQYHFDSKEGLHRACAEMILGHAAQALSTATGRSEAALERQDAAGARDSLCDLFDAMLDATLEGDGDHGRSRFMTRLQADRAGPAWAELQARLLAPLLDLCARLVGAARRSEMSSEIRLRASLLLSQLSAVHASQETTLNAVGWSDFNGDRREILKRVIRTQTKAALRGPVADQEEGAASSET